jgi:flagellar motor switch protein FliM
MAVSQSDEAGTEPAAGAAPSEQEEIRALDFSQPTKFTTDIRRHIAAALHPLCASLSASLSTQLKTEVELSMGEIVQSTWASARARLATDAVAVSVQAGEPERQMLLSVDLGLVLQGLECLLGGKATNAPAERHLSDIDWALAKGLIDHVVGEISGAWEEIDGPQLLRGELDVEGDAGVSAPAGEPTLSVAFQASIEGCDSTMSLLLPWVAVESVVDGAHSHHPGHGTSAQEGEDEGLRSGLAEAQVLLRAEVGSVQMPIEQMLEIVPGTLVELAGRSEEGVVLYAEEVSIGRGRPGRSGTHKAVKLEAAGEEAIRADTYAKLGRGDLERARAHALSSSAEGGKPAILRSIFVRVWAELGRTHMTLGGTLELTPGAVVELDQSAEAPVELFANGLCFANGRLVVTGEGAWGVTVDQLV